MPGPDIVVTALYAERRGEWREYPPSRDLLVLPELLVAFRVENRDGVAIYAAVIARDRLSRARVASASERIAPGKTAMLGHRRPIIPSLGTRLMVVYSPDRSAIGRLLQMVRAKGHLAGLDRVEVADFGTLRPPRASLDRRKFGIELREELSDLYGVIGAEAWSEPPLARRRAAAKAPARRTAQPPTRSAYGRLDAPTAAPPGAEFPVVIGITAKPEPGVVSARMTLPDPRRSGSYVIDVLLIAEGCTLREGESWRTELRVTAKDPFPSVVVHLTIDPDAGSEAARTIQVLYSVEGATVGAAARTVTVVATGTDVPPPPRGGGLFGYAIPPRYPVPDLTIRITVDPLLPVGTLLWHIDSPHRSVPRWDRRIATSTGTEPREFAKQLMRDINAHEGKPDLVETVRGYAVSITRNMPREVLDAVRAAATASSRPPRVLVLSAEPYVPWELALLDPPIDPDAPPFLGAQAVVGRWVLGNVRSLPPSRVPAAPMAVVTGVYDRPGLKRLVEAEAEADSLAKDYGATRVSADLPSVHALLKGTPPAKTLHFALHGTYDPTGLTDGLHLVDGEMLPPTTVRGSTLADEPFVYLNACQVGTGNAVLGDYAGLAAAFLDAGASGVVAPLWRVDDTLAREVALRMYPAVFGRTFVGEALREERAAFVVDPAPASATPLAYQFFGHPALVVSRPRRSR